MLKSKKIYTIPIFIFLILILITSIFLKLPFYNKTKINYIDALFEATSAVTATGSTVVDLETQFSFAGQVIILLAMQIGAVGFMLFFSILFSISRKKLKLSNTILVGNEINTKNYASIKEKAKKISKYTLLIEFIGAWLLSFKFIPIYGFKDGLWYSIFHSISAFCNVGLDVFTTESLSIFQKDIYINCVFIMLMFLGSLGFLVLEDFEDLLFKGKRNNNHFQSRLILDVSIVIIVIGTILIKIFEPQLTFLETIFEVISARNTGLYTINQGTLSQMSKLIISIIMFIGGGPGSNAGGVRIMVFAVLILTTIQNIKGRDDVVIFYRKIDDKLIKRAITIFIMDMIVIFLGIIAMALVENESVLDNAFYVISTFSNTGFVTIDIESLSFAGKCISIFIMYIGRIAPITFISLFMPINYEKSGIKYPNIDLVL